MSWAWRSAFFWLSLILHHLSQRGWGMGAEIKYPSSLSFQLHSVRKRGKNLSTIVLHIAMEFDILLFSFYFSFFTKFRHATSIFTQKMFKSVFWPRYYAYIMKQVLTHIHRMKRLYIQMYVQMWSHEHILYKLISMIFVNHPNRFFLFFSSFISSNVKRHFLVDQKWIHISVSR